MEPDLKEMVQKLEDRWEIARMLNQLMDEALMEEGLVEVGVLEDRISHLKIKNAKTM